MLETLLVLAQEGGAMIGNVGLALAGIGVGVGLIVIGGAKGIGNIGGHAVDAIARQPEAGGRIGTNMIIAAALIEGFTFFALIIAIMALGKVVV
jgi:F-type H+-transporting ATPase subunit c